MSKILNFLKFVFFTTTLPRKAILKVVGENVFLEKKVAFQ